MHIDNVIEAYDYSASEYDAIMERYWNIDRQPLIDSLQLQPGQKVLDAAVGTGLNLPAFPAQVQVIGIDLSQKMLNEARKKPICADIILQVMDLHQLNFSDNSFDAAVSGFTLCVVTDPVEVLEEILRVTKSGALIAILDYCKSRNPEIEKWQELIYEASSQLGFPRGKIKWNSLMDYDKLIYHSNLAIEVIKDERIDDPNPFLCGCEILLRNTKQ
ncbi:Methyltransferase type 11 [Gloeothece citriformis PCC 7424]|uniref:Methyltransferase type 11 n=1 Tax=Gloeothece citriformis (strain PCC 7424) TaxID=65393 RepID=B7KAT4_GLOC7|nr:methyltransferase domain-containing protein [Gloeothece citriformis]ACK68756.1 Methyltransferase type 11 [Gloeothece citriformis PCC 7424]